MIPNRPRPVRRIGGCGQDDEAAFGNLHGRCGDGFPAALRGRRRVPLADLVHGDEVRAQTPDRGRVGGQDLHARLRAVEVDGRLAHAERVSKLGRSRLESVHRVHEQTALLLVGGERIHARSRRCLHEPDDDVHAREVGRLRVATGAGEEVIRSLPGEDRIGVATLEGVGGVTPAPAVLQDEPVQKVAGRHLSVSLVFCPSAASAMSALSKRSSSRAICAMTLAAPRGCVWSY